VLVSTQVLSSTLTAKPTGNVRQSHVRDGRISNSMNVAKVTVTAMNQGLISPRRATCPPLQRTRPGPSAVLATLPVVCLEMLKRPIGPLEVCYTEEPSGRNSAGRQIGSFL